MFTLERVTKKGVYILVGKYETFDSALEKMKEKTDNNRYEIWHPIWINTAFGYAPMASKN